MDTITLYRQLETFQAQLIDWYDTHQRDLPWRNLSSLYKTVVSEFMLQQTQVKTVLPYFEKWMTDYPDFSALAKASENQVLKSWEGLGSIRARNLHKLAQTITSLNIREMLRAGSPSQALVATRPRHLQYILF